MLNECLKLSFFLSTFTLQQQTTNTVIGLKKIPSNVIMINSELCNWGKILAERKKVFILIEIVCSNKKDHYWATWNRRSHDVKVRFVVPTFELRTGPCRRGHSRTSSGRGHRCSSARVKAMVGSFCFSFSFVLQIMFQSISNIDK